MFPPFFSPVRPVLGGICPRSCMRHRGSHSFSRARRVIRAICGEHDAKRRRAGMHKLRSAAAHYRHAATEIEAHVCGRGGYENQPWQPEETAFNL